MVYETGPTDELKLKFLWALLRASLVALAGKNPPAHECRRHTGCRLEPGPARSLEEGMATRSLILESPWAGEPEGLQPTVSQRVWYDWRDLAHKPYWWNKNEYQELCLPSPYPSILCPLISHQLDRPSSKKSTNNKCWRGCGENRTLLYSWWECKLMKPLWRTQWRRLKKLGIKPPCVKVSVAQACLTCIPVDCSPPGSSVHRILQARILEWVAIPLSGDLPDPGIKLTQRSHYRHKYPPRKP